MLCRAYSLLPIALTGVICLAAPASLYAQMSTGTTGGRSTGSGSYGSGTGTSLGGGSSSSSFGFNSSSFGLGSTGTGTGTSNTSPFGSSAGAGGSTSGYGATSLFGPYLANPMAAGVPGTATSTSKTFGQPLFNVSSSGVYNTNTTGGGRGNTLGGALGGRAGSMNYGAGATGNINRAGSTSTMNAAVPFRSNAAPYTTRIAFVVTPPSREELRSDLARVIAQSADLPSRSGISVQMEGNTVVLQGQVSTNEERRVVESLVRLTPGVQGVRNELVPQTAAGD
jgi:hypothetical protein